MAVSTIAALPDFLPKLEAAEPAGTILTAIILVGFVGVGIWLLIEAGRRRTGVLILLLVGGLVAGLQEPMIDELGKVWWPTNLAGPAFTIFSRPMPYLQPTGYAMYIAL